MTQPVLPASGVELINTATGTVTGEHVYNYARRATFQATGKTWSGSGAVTVAVEFSNDALTWLKAADITLNLNDAALTTDGFVSDAPWRWVRGRVTAISGTGAYVTVTMGA